MDIPQELVVICDRGSISALTLVCKRFHGGIMEMSASTDFWLKLSSVMLGTDMLRLSVELEEIERSRPTKKFVNVLRNIVRTNSNVITDDLLTLKILWRCVPTNVDVFNYLKENRKIATLRAISDSPIDAGFAMCGNVYIPDGDGGKLCSFLFDVVAFTMNMDLPDHVIEHFSAQPIS